MPRRTGRWLIRRATPDDVPAAARVLARAFADYPWTRWSVAADGHAARLVALHTTYLTELGIPYGRVDVAADDDAITAAAVWMPSDAAIPDHVLARVGQAVARYSGDRADVTARAEPLLAAHRPTGAHLTLATVGVDPAAQGHGAGSALLAAGLRAADRRAVPAYLETSAEANVGLYRRHGFEVTAVVDLPDGPRTWCMLRAPRAG